MPTTNPQPLFETTVPTSELDPVYVHIRDHVHCDDYRQYLEGLWAEYVPYADRNFLDQVQRRGQFHSRVWEMRLTVVLKRLGLAVAVRGSEAGPDIKIEGTPTTWIEAVAPSTTDELERSRELALQGPTPAPEKQVVLRYTQALAEKWGKYLGYTKAGVVKPSDAFVIAVNAANLHTPKRLRRMPDGMSFELAAALPVAGLTALKGLRECGDLHGKMVLINGGTGSVGHFAVQIAKARGATVTAVCSERNAGRARSFGADVVIDYRKQDFTAGSVRYDVVFDAFGHLKYPDVARVFTDDGTLVTTLPALPLIARAVWQKVVGGWHRIVLGNLRDHPEDYAELERLLAEGSVKPVIDKIFPLAEAAQAYAALEAGGTVGKVIIRIV
ncbi:MAG TPA: NAD(P)-dependent alcohol dehydrogenase [Polyangia bacterium]|nr:NAD(P)-dependent alcohol dehydrogenase [Polyangia bacterium]